MAPSPLEVGRGAAPTISVVICAYNSRERIDAALSSLRAQDLDEPFEVIAVVSGNDGCAEYLANQHPNVRVVNGGARLRPGAARNAGLEAASGAVIAFLPDDGVATTGWLRARLAKHRAGYLLVGGAVSNATPRSLVGTAGYYVEYAASMPVARLLEKQVIPHTLSYHRDVFDRVDRFPDLDVPGEDTVFNARCIADGLDVVYEPGACIGHVNLTSFRAFLAHQFDHGRGLARCVVEQGLEGPFNAGDGPWRTAHAALLRYPIWRWAKTLRLLACTAPREVPLFLVLTPIVAAGYLAGGAGSWLVLRSLTR